MKIEWLVTDVTAIGPGVILAGRVFGQFRTCLWSLRHFVMLEPPLSAINFIWGHLVKTEWLVADVTVVRSLDRAECATYFGGVCGWACFWPNRGHFCGR